MPDLSFFVDWLVNSSFSLWAFLVSGWFVALILIKSIILPKLLQLFRLSIGR